MYKITTLVHNRALLPAVTERLEEIFGLQLSVGKRNTEIWYKIDDIVHITTVGLQNGRF